MGTFMEKCFGFSPIREELEARISELENENTELLREREYLAAETSELKDANNQLRQAREKLTKEKTELEREIARLKSLESMEAKIDLDLHNRRLASANQDLKRQNRKLEEENMVLKERAYGLNEQLFTLQPQNHNKGNIMVKEKSLELPLGHPLVEKLCDRSLKDGVKFNEKIPIHFKDEVSKEDQTKFKQALRVLHAIVNNETSLKYLSDADENQKFIEDLAQDKKITNEKIEKTLEIVSYSDVDVDFERFK